MEKLWFENMYKFIYNMQSKQSCIPVTFSEHPFMLICQFDTHEQDYY